MGINFDLFHLLDSAFESLNKNFNYIKICEFGAQEIRTGHVPDNHPAKQFKIAKDYFKYLGAEHVSMDINNKFGSIDVDLSKPVPQWNNYFNLLTNFGTSEHIKNSQYQVFKNAHDMLVKNGVSIHTVPMIGRILRMHPPETTVYYHPDFFISLCKKNNYKILESCVKKRGRKLGGLLCCVFVK